MPPVLLTASSLGVLLSPVAPPAPVILLKSTSGCVLSAPLLSLPTFPHWAFLHPPFILPSQINYFHSCVYSTRLRFPSACQPKPRMSSSLAHHRPAMLGLSTPPVPFLYPVLVFPTFPPSPTPCPQSSLPRWQLATVLLQVFLPRSPPSQVPGLVPHLSQPRLFRHMWETRLPGFPSFPSSVSASRWLPYSSHSGLTMSPLLQFPVASQIK